MFRLTNRLLHRQNGSLLASAFMISAVLAIALTGLINYSRISTQQTDSLISKFQLRQMAQEKFTRDLMALNKNVDLHQFNVAPATFSCGMAQSQAYWVHDFPVMVSPIYLVVVATISSSHSAVPHHLRLETLIEYTQPSVPASRPNPSSVKLNNYELISQMIDGYLMPLISQNDPQYAAVKASVLSELEKQLGSQWDSVSLIVEPAQYREAPISPSEQSVSSSEQEGVFSMSPLSFEKQKSGARVKLWKETYY